MAGNRLYAVRSAGLALFIFGCGTDTPPDAVVTAVESNRTTTYTLNTVPTQVVDGAIHFKVQASLTDNTPVGGVNVELSGSSPTVGDPASGFVATLTAGGAFLNPADPNRVVAKTGSNGVVTALYQFTVPKCNLTADVTVSASISASIGASTATWIDTIKITTDPSC